MLKTSSHAWNLSPARARELQETLSKKVISKDRLGTVRFVAGLDASFDKKNGFTYGAAVVLRFPELTLHESASCRRKTSFPYIPGLLSFREGPALLGALKKLKQTPDLLLCDGQGIAHPRRLGIAAHLGVLTGIPSIGAAKSRLIGEHRSPGIKKGAWAPLVHKGERIGAVLRTRDRVNPLFVSIGHKVALTTAIDWVLRCTPRFRLPETTRWAHRLATERAAQF